ncbi:Pycsar system effector family protein [Herbaspirillum autotrophicum]|uniref:Pycsar system effector family protein n=1 Tax=Herbaspirillum autotrophicum TaxID=180195 RepID=UPI00067C73E4|nr:Pycsar system effector family protein [Herbaspirillum autotrophicum]
MPRATLTTIELVKLRIKMEDSALKGHSRLESAQWVFERQISWINGADVKVGVIVALDLALIGGLASAFNISDEASRYWWTYALIGATALLLALALLFAAIALNPKTNGPAQSLLFFGPISKKIVFDYQSQFLAATEEELLLDWTQQIHRNALIACDKYRFVRRSMTCSFLASVPWIAAVAFLMKF